MNLGSNYLMYAAYVIALIEVTLGLYALVVNPRRSVNQNIALLLSFFALNSLGIGLLISADQEWQTLLPTSLLAFTTPAVEPLLILTTLFLLKPGWQATRTIVPKQGITEPTGRKKPGTSPLPQRSRLMVFVAALLYSFAALPLLLLLFDLSSGGAASPVAGLPALYYTGITPGTYAGGFLDAHFYTGGILAGIVRSVYFVGFSVVLMGLLVYFIFFDRTLDRPARRMAWVQFITLLVVTTLQFVFENSAYGGLISLLSGSLFAFVYSIFAYQQILTQRTVQRGSLIYRITALVLVVSLPLMIALILLITSRAGELVSAGSEAVLEQQNKALGINVETWLDLNSRALTSLALDREIRSMDPNRQVAALQIVANTYPFMDLVATTNSEGMNIARSDNNPLENNSARLWFNQAMQGRQSSQVLLSRTGKPVLVVARPIYESLNVITGVVMFEADLSEISKQFQTVRIGQTGEAFLVNEIDQLIAHPDPTFTSWLRDYSNYPPVQALRAGKTGAVTFLCTGSFCGVQNELRHAYVTSLSNGWGVIVEQSESELFTPLRQIQQLAFTILIVGLILLGLAVTFTVRQGLRPVKVLTETVSAIAGGDLSHQVPVESDLEYTTRDEMGFLAQTFNAMTRQLRELIGGLETRVEERTRDLAARSTQLEAAAQVARSAAGIRDLRVLLTQATQLISSTFGYYHTGIFIIDEAREYAVLQAANSEGGRRLLARGHKLKVGQVGIVGYVAAIGRPRIALDVGKDAVYFNNPDLPDTRSELALPLIAGRQVIGVLDVQSTQSQAYKEEDIEVLQILADQLALAIENIRLLEETRRALEELRSLYSDRTRQDWQERLRRGAIAYQYTRMGVTALHLSPALKMESARPDSQLPVIAPEDQTAVTNSHVLQMPISLRDQKLGSLILRRDPDQPEWSEEETRITQEAITQIAAALENARLLEEAQVHSTQLRLLQEITAVAASHTNLIELLDHVSQKLRAGLDFFHCGVILRPEILAGSDPGSASAAEFTRGTLVINACADPLHPAARQIGITLPLDGASGEADQKVSGQSPFIAVINEHRTVVVYDVLQALPPGPLRDFARQRDSGTMLITPLLSRGQVIGFLVMDIQDKNRRFSSEDLQLLDQISLQISSAIDVARSFEQTTRRAEREQLLGEVSGRIRETLDIDTILRTTAQEVRRMLDLPEVTIHLVEPGEPVKPEEESDASV